jgi:hypothetical protein
VISHDEYAIGVEFSSAFSDAVWILTNIYAPCTTEGKVEFFIWFHNFTMPDNTDWLVVGDFNLIRKPSARNRPRGNVQEMLKFNEAISNLRLEELPLQGQRYTWTNKQASPLLERLDWFFASITWITSYLGSSVLTLSSDVSDHYPCLVSMNTDISKANVFQFENFWLLHEDFMPVMQHGWNLTVGKMDGAKRMMAKVINLRRIHKYPYAQIPNLVKTI